MSAAFSSAVTVRGSAFHGKSLFCAGASLTKCARTVSTEMSATRKMPAVVRPLVPSKTLQELVPDRAQPRSDVLKALSAYAKSRGLQDPNDKKLVHCDAKLKAILGVESCTFLSMSKYITRHLSKPEDVGGKYIEEAQQYEEKWMKENDEKSKTKKPATRKATSSEAMASNRGLWSPVILSSDLAHVCGQKEMPRQQIIKAVWSYIRTNNLQSGPGQPVACDASLKKVFQQDNISSKDIMKGIQPHVSKK